MKSAAEGSTVSAPIMESHAIKVGQSAATVTVASKRGVDDKVNYTDLLLVDDKPIGSGGFGDIYKAHHKEWNCLVIYKKLNIHQIDGTETTVQALRYEAEIHRPLRHQNVVSMLGVVFEEGNYGLVLEYICYGSLDDFLKRIKEIRGSAHGVHSRLKSKMAYDVCSGMTYLHSLKPSPIIHGDLKIQNLLIGELLKVKISDFGLSKWRNFTRSFSIFAPIHGTITHVPPEKFNNSRLKANEKFDVYSFGIMLWEMFTEEKAYSDCEEMNDIMVIVGKSEQEEYLSLDNILADVANWIRTCWNRDPKERPTFSNLASNFKTLTGSENEVEHDVGEVLSIYHGRSNKTRQSLHGCKLERVSHKLGEVIRRTDQILTHLLQAKSVTSQEYDEIRSQSTVYSLMRCLIDVLSAKPVTAYRCFLDALGSTNQKHILQLLEHGFHVNDEHKEKLIDNYAYLKSNLSVHKTTLLDHLLQSHVLDEQEVLEIHSKRTERERVEQLLHFIMRTSHEQYEQFLEALEAAGQTFIKENLIANGTVTMLSAVPFRIEETATEVLGLGQKQRETITQSTFGNNFEAAASEFALHVQKIIQLPEEMIHLAGAAESVGRLDNNSILPLFLDNPSVIHIIPDEGWVYGVTGLGNQIFVARHAMLHVEVYDSTNFNSPPLVLKLSESPLSYPKLAVSAHHNCIYVAVWKGRTEAVFYRVDLSTIAIYMWTVTVNGSYRGISVTYNHNLLLAIADPGRLQEYTPQGELVREIVLDSSVDNPQQCVQLLGGNFVLSHEGTSQDRVCIVDDSGQIIRSYGGLKGPGVGQLNCPRLMAVDKYGYVFVADWANRRVQLLSPELTHLGNIKTPGNKIKDAYSLYIDDSCGRLYVGELFNGQVLVLEVCATVKA